MSTPTLTRIRTYNPAHFVEAAPQWDLAADNWQFHTLGALNDFSTLGLEGRNSTATLDRLGQTHTRAVAAAAPVSAAAGVAASASGTMTAMQSRVMAIVSWCLEGAYWVDDDLQLTDMFRSPNAAVFKARSQIQDWLQDMLHDAATQMSAADAAIAKEIDTHAQMLDFATTKGHLDGGQCDDPDYQSGVERRLGASVIGGILVGGVVGGPAGAITGGAGAGIADIIHEITGDGPSCQ